VSRTLDDESLEKVVADTILQANNGVPDISRVSYANFKQVLQSTDIETRIRIRI